MKKIVYILMIPILLNIFSFAEDIKLYKNYIFGMNRSDIMKIKDVYDCSNYAGEHSLCLDGQTFSELNTTIIYKFINNVLSQIILPFEYTHDNYLNLFGTINNKFTFLAMQNKKNRLDLIELYNNEPKNVKSKVSVFESTSLAQGNITYIFIDNNNTNKFRRQVSNVVELILKSDNIREIDFQIATNNNGKFILLSFNTPNLALKMIKNNFKKNNTEDF